MNKKRNIRIILVVSLAVILAVAATVLAEGFSRSDATENAGDFHRVGFDGYDVFISDDRLMLMSDVPCSQVLNAHADQKAANAFLTSLSKLNFRVLDDAETDELVKAGEFKGYTEFYSADVVDKNYNKVITFGFLRNPDTGEWSRGMFAHINVNDDVKTYMLLSPEESFDSAVIENIMDSAFGGDFEAYYTAFEEKRNAHELTEDWLINGMPNIDYRTYSESSDKINRNYENSEEFLNLFCN